MNIRGNKARCPLCQGHLVGDPETPSFPIVKKPGISAFSIIKMATFCFLAIEIVMGTVWFLTNYCYHISFPWVPLVMLGTVVLWVDLLVAIYVRNNILRIITYEAYIAIAADFIIDLKTGFHAWSLNWMIPSTLVGLSLATVLFGLLSKMRLSDYVIYLLTNTVLSLVQLWSIGTGKTTFVWPSIICIAAHLILTAWIVVFKSHDLKNASAKYFNI